MALRQVVQLSVGAVFFCFGVALTFTPVWLSLHLFHTPPHEINHLALRLGGVRDLILGAWCLVTDQPRERRGLLVAFFWLNVFDTYSYFATAYEGVVDFRFARGSSMASMMMGTLALGASAL